MPYYPKSQVKTNLYTKGGQFQVVSTKREYIGYYWKNSKGEYFTQKNPNVAGIEPLEFIPKIASPSSSSTTYTKGNIRYNAFKKVDITKSFLLPIYQKPSPTNNDYSLGNFTRYFAKKINELLYIEISKNIFDELQNKNTQYSYSSYLIFNLTWTLIGDKPKIAQTNRNIITLTEQNYNIVGLGKYLKFNYLEFYK